jgi:hypothetical protein
MRTGSKGGNSLVFYSFQTQAIRPVEVLDSRFQRHFSISADQRWLIYDAVRYRSGDLMMIENVP